MSALVSIDGGTFELDEVTAYYDDLRVRVLAGEGVFLEPVTGDALDPVDQNRLRARYRAAGAGDSLRRRSQFAREETWWSEREPLIPGLMDRDQHSLLIGQKGAGKSRFAIDLLETAIRPGHKLFGRFDPANLGPTDKCVYINAETSPALIEDELERRGMNAYGLRPFEVVHLARMGGAPILDITNRQNFDAWADYLAACTSCDGTDFEVPALIIMDGKTAVLGETANRYGEWAGQWFELMAYVGVRASLVVAHATYDGKHALGDTTSWTGYQGVWFLTKSGTGVRTFRTESRFSDDLDVKPFRVVLGADGRQYPAPTQQAKRNKKVDAEHNLGEPTAEARDAKPEPTVVERVLDFVAAENENGVEPRHKQVLAAVGGTEAKVVQAIVDLVASGRLEREARAGRGGQAFYYRLGTTGQDGDDTKLAK